LGAPLWGSAEWRCFAVTNQGILGRDILPAACVSFDDAGKGKKP
jgi:hypothetical protein